MTAPHPEPQTSGEFSPDGKTGSISKSISFSGGTATGPGFSETYTLSVPAGNIYSISVSADDTATVSGEGFSASSYWDASAKRIVSGAASSDWKELEEGTGDVAFTISYENKGGPYVLQVTVTSTRTPRKHPDAPRGDEKCGCSADCPMNSTAKLGSVDFSQPFGRTPFAPGFSSGTLAIKKQLPTKDLFKPVGLQYDYFLTRTASSIDFATQSATISADGLWENVYRNGVPAENNAWKSSQIQVATDGSVTETLSNRTVIRYDTTGAFSSATSPEGVTLTKNQLGVEVFRDESGALRQIWSLADGLLDIVTISEKSYEIRWYKADSILEKNAESGLFTTIGEPIKTFVCEAPDGTTGVFKLTEHRGNTFEFENTWTFNALDNEWTLDKGDIHLARRWTEQENGNFLISETHTDASGTTKSFTETISPTNGNQYVGKAFEGVPEYTATRVASGNGLGKIASETDRSGATRNYVYDTHARVVHETLSKGYADLPETTDYTYAETASDLRPRTIVH
ncbi:MAG: hypothetical protein IJY80_00690, partial [Opitutales bacterium]|nr:hypothetical protein [Opitutales bacterium]